MRRPVTDRNERPSPLTTPAVTVLWNPSGLPIAMTSCPTRSAPESPSSARAREGGSTRITATSVSGSSPTSSARSRRPSAKAASIRVASCTTWLFVRMKPSGVNTNPEPWPGSSRAGGAHVRLVYKGLSESGTAEAGSAAQAGESCIADYHDAEGHHVQATFRGLPEGVPTEPLRSGVEIATHLAVMVARRATLERERRLGTFLVELSRWLLAAPERDLLLRYTLQSVVSLVEAQGAFVALRQPDGDTLRIAATVGQCVELDGADIGLTTSTTGRVVRSGEPLLTDNLLAEPDAQVALNPARSARGAMIAPLKTSSGVVGAVGVVRYEQPDAVEPAPPAFGLVELQYLAAVAAYIAGGLELSEAVTGARAAAERAHAMVDSSPLPLALVDRQGRVLQVNQAGCRLFGIATESQALGLHLEALGLSPSEISLHLVLARPRIGRPWHGRAWVTQPGGDRRICDCTITGLSGVGRDSLLLALYDRTDELRAQRELIAREKLATVGEIASGAQIEVNTRRAG